MHLELECSHLSEAGLDARCCRNAVGVSCTTVARAKLGKLSRYNLKIHLDRTFASEKFT